MCIRSLKERLKRLQNGPLRALVALLATVQQSVKYRSPILIYVDKDGDWHNCRPDATFVSPELNVSSLSAVQAAVMDLWCYDYRLQRGDTVVDVGAGIGDDVVVFSRLVGVNGRVIAIEAHPKTFRCLTKTIEANRLGNVIALNIAASDQTGEASISDGENFLTNSIVGGEGAVRIRARELDDVLSEIGATCSDLIKMNIEGAETNALRGLKATLRVAPHVVVSCHDFIADNHGGDPTQRTYDDVNRILRDAGYVMRARREGGREELNYYVYGGK